MMTWIIEPASQDNLTQLIEAFVALAKHVGVIKADSTMATILTITITTFD